MTKPAPEPKPLSAQEKVAIRRQEARKAFLYPKPKPAGELKP